MFALAWQIEELKELCSECCTLTTEVNAITDLVGNPVSGSEQHVNITRWLTVLRDRLCVMIKAVYVQAKTSHSRLCFHDITRAEETKTLCYSRAMCTMY